MSKGEYYRCVNCNNDAAVARDKTDHDDIAAYYCNSCLNRISKRLNEPEDPECPGYKLTNLALVVLIVGLLLAIMYIWLH